MPRGAAAPVARGDPESQRLPEKVRARLPELPPVPAHGGPRESVPLDLHLVHVTRPRHVPHENKVEVGVPGYSKPDPALLPARHATVCHGHDPSLVLRDLEERGLGKIEVSARRVAPPAVVAGESVVGRAVVGAADEHGGVPGLAPLRVVRALDLVARAACEPVRE